MVRKSRAFVSTVLSGVVLASASWPAKTARIEIRTLQTTTLSDEQFLNGVREGIPVTISGDLRIPGTSAAGRVPAVVLLHGSGGINASHELWSQEFLGMGIATFIVDSFSGRGIVRTSSDQAQLGSLAMIMDAYRALELLAHHPRIDPQRIALMGFSRGGHSALYASVRRFQRMHGPPGLEFAAYIPFYAACNIKFRGDGDVSDRPIRIHHGLADDFIPIAPCRLYVARLRAANKDVVLTAYPNAYHFFDNPGIPQPRQAVRWQTTRSCAMHEDQNGRVINNASGRMFSYEDACVELGPTQGYNAEAHAASVRAVKAFLSSTFGL